MYPKEMEPELRPAAAVYPEYSIGFGDLTTDSPPTSSVPATLALARFETPVVLRKVREVSPPTSSVPATFAACPENEIPPLKSAGPVTVSTPRFAELDCRLLVVKLLAEIAPKTAVPAVTEAACKIAVLDTPLMLELLANRLTAFTVPLKLALPENREAVFTMLRLETPACRVPETLKEAAVRAPTDVAPALRPPTLATPLTLALFAVRTVSVVAVAVRATVCSELVEREAMFACPLMLVLVPNNIPMLLISTLALLAES